MDLPLSAESPLVDDAQILADGFSRRITHLALALGASEGDARLAARAAALVSRALADGHVCVPLADLAQRAGAHSEQAMRAALFASGLACEGAGNAVAATPIVIDRQQRVYLARYYDYERRLARAVAGMVRQRNGGGAALGKRDDGGPGGEECADDDTSGATAVATMHSLRGDISPTLPPPDVALSERLDRHFGPLRADARHPVDWQRVAAALSLGARLTIVSGGPGTGKTTTVAGLLGCLLDTNPALRIALAAPTGKAAQRMQEALAGTHHVCAALASRLPKRSATLHRLLGGLPDGRFRYHRGAPLPYDVVVVDEASMIDLAMATRLFDAIAPHARLVMLGDKDQLAAVEAGAVFGELSAQAVLSAACRASIAAALGIDAALLVTGGNGQGDSDSPLVDSVVWLERNYRFGLDSAIGRLSVAVRDGMLADALAELAVQLRPSTREADAVLIPDEGAALSVATVSHLVEGFEPYARALSGFLATKNDGSPEAGYAQLFAALNEYRVLCAVRGGPRGADALNAALAVRLRGSGSAPRTPDTWYAGRAVMVTRNDYALGLFNGDIGIALPVAGGALRVVFAAPSRGYRSISPAALPPHDTAFAMTVHKSQGSEFLRAALVLPAKFSRALTRELVYTAITRARRQVVIVGAANVLAQAIQSRTTRDSGLRERLAEALRGHAPGETGGR